MFDFFSFSILILARDEQFCVKGKSNHAFWECESKVEHTYTQIYV